MPYPTLTKSWTFSPNNTITFVSLNDTMARYLYGIKNFLVTTMGWTVVYTCDGTTGPSSASDHTDRWASSTNAATRGTSSTVAQSFAVLQDGNGVQLMLAYQGASDDIARISFSQGAQFTPAATANNQPTAGDESILATATSLINSTASGNRVWHISASTDKKIVRWVLYRSGTMLPMFGLEQISPTQTSYATWTPAVVGWSTAQTDVNNNFAAGRAFGSVSNTTGTLPTCIARIGGTNVAIGGGGEAYCGSFSGARFTVAAPELNGAAPIVPLVFSSTTAGFAGKLGNRIDAWFPYWNGLSQGDTFNTLAFVFMGTFLFPWDNATTPATS